MGDVVGNFLEPLKLHFIMPKAADTDPDAFWAAYASDLAEFSDEALNEAVIRLRRREGASTVFPALRDCLAICRHVADEKARITLGKKRRSADDAARLAHFDRLNRVHLEGDTECAARLLLILAVRSGQTRGWDFGPVPLEIRRVAVERLRGPKWLLSGKKAA